MDTALISLFIFEQTIKGLVLGNIGITKVFLKAYNTKLSRKLFGYLDEDNLANYIKVMVKIGIELD